jgi:capsular polysaccharide biosynthesis protein
MGKEFPEGGSMVLAIPSWVFNHINIYKIENDFLVSMDDENFGGYGHYILDILPALIQLNKKINIKILINKDQYLYKNLLISSCELFDIDYQESYVDNKNLRPLSVEEVKFFGIEINKTYSYYPGYLKMSLVVGRFPEKNSIVRPFRYVYVARSSLESSGRIMINESVLIDWLKRNKFEVVYPETLSIMEQFSLFREAKLVVGVAGSALLNVTFMTKDSTILEISPSSDCRYGVATISSIIKVNYFNFSGLYSSNEVIVDHKTDKFSVDMESLTAKISKLLIE